jgi:hypothetical protein
MKLFRGAEAVAARSAGTATPSSPGSIKLYYNVIYGSKLSITNRVDRNVTQRMRLSAPRCSNTQHVAWHIHHRGTGSVYEVTVATEPVETRCTVLVATAVEVFHAENE